MGGLVPGVTVILVIGFSFIERVEFNRDGISSQKVLLF